MSALVPSRCGLRSRIVTHSPISPTKCRLLRTRYKVRRSVVFVGKAPEMSCRRGLDASFSLGRGD